MKTKPYVKALHSDVFRRSVIVMVGELDAGLRARFLAELRGRADPEVVRNSWDRVAEACRDTWKEKPYQGVTVHVSGDVYIHLPVWRLPVFVHEAYHAMRYVMSDISSSDEEVSALVIEWIFDEVCADGRRPGGR